MKGAVKTLFFLSMLMVTSAQAKIYMCKDASGKTLSSDRPIPECADRPVREYSNNGSKHKDMPRHSPPNKSVRWNCNRKRSGLNRPQPLNKKEPTARFRRAIAAKQISRQRVNGTPIW